MHRRRLLELTGSVAVAGLTGCSALPSSGPATEIRSPDGPTPSSDADYTPPEMLTPAPDRCAAASLPRPSTGQTLPEPLDYPEKPDLTDRSAVREFLEAFERAFLYNRRLATLAEEGACVSHFDTTVVDSRLVAIGNGFAAAVTTRGSYTGEECTSDAPGTPVGHRDFFPSPGHLRVTDRFLLREGLTLACWE